MKNLQANELRIGNWVRLYLNHEDYNEFNIELADLNLIANSKSGREYQPIPLTEEWLLKFGFEFNHQNEYWKHYQNDKGFNISQWVHTTKFAGFEKFGLFYYGDGYLEVKCVHIFQNLYFALTGNELEVKS